MKLRFGTSLKTYIEFLAVAHNLLHDLANLVDLDRINNEILSLIIILLRCLLEAT